MRRLAAKDVHELKVAELGMDSSSLDLLSTEAIAGSIRRSASFLCPCPATTLVRNVLVPLRGLASDLDSIKATVTETLEAMVAHGDLFEYRQIDASVDSQPSTLLYAAPASFVMRQSGAVLLLGIAMDHLSALPDELTSRIEYSTFVRRLRPSLHEDLRAELSQLGLIEISDKDWLKTPSESTAADYASRINQRLTVTSPSREVLGLRILESDRPVDYYPKRWSDPRSQTGLFVGRRSRAYGADLWCYVEMRNGQPERLIDFPSPSSRWRGCDEAWYLQMALDALRGNAQRFRTRRTPDGSILLELFSPVPMWAQRRWNAFGEPVPPYNCLLAYRFSKSEIEEECQFARRMLWLEPM